MKNSIQVFGGTAHPQLAQKIADYLNIPLGRVEVDHFPDGEINVKVLDDVRGGDIFVVQSTCPPVNENLMELLIMIDCLRRASADRITAVIPYFGYARQDRKAEGRVPITAKLVANLITTSGADRVLAMDLHAAQIQGFFDIPMDHLFAAPVMIEHFKKLDLSNLTIVSPDVGGIKMARAYAKRLGADLAIIDKRRSDPEATEVMHVIGEVKGRTVVLVDDLISTGSTIVEAVRALRHHGANDVYLCATHAVLCKGAAERIRQVEPKQTIVTDTIPVQGGSIQNLHVLSVATLLGEAIQRIHKSESVSSLFV